MKIDAAKRRRRGPAPLNAAKKRNHTVSVRVNPAELAQLDALREKVSMQRGEYLRAAALHKLPPTIPEINREAWAALARSAANLNQIAHKMNAGELPQVEQIREVLDALRRDLIGMTPKKNESED